MTLDLNTIVLIFIRSMAFTIPLPIGTALADYLKRGVLAVVLTFVAALYYSDLSLPAFSAASIFSNILLGIVMSAPCILTIEAASYFAELIDSGRGVQFSAFYDQVSGGQNSLLSIYSKYLIIAVLLAGGMGEAYLTFFLRSFGNELNFNAANLVQVGSRWGLLMVQYLGSCFLAYLPLGLLFILSDWGISVVGKILPSLKLNQESFLIKSVAVFILMIIIFENWGIAELLLKLARPLKEFFSF